MTSQSFRTRWQGFQRERATQLALACFVTAFTSLLIYKVALFTVSALSMEGQTSALRTYARIPLCMGWDVIASVVGAAFAYGGCRLSDRVGFRHAPWCVGIALALHAAYLVLALRVAMVIGAPPDKAALDLAFFSMDETAVQRESSMSSSIALYLTPKFGAAFGAAIVAAVAIFRAARRRTWRIAGYALALGMSALITSVFVVPAIQNTYFAVHTYGLERSPGILMASSYVRPMLRKLMRRKTATRLNDAFCLDLRSPYPPRAFEREPLLATAKPKQTNVVLVVLESIAAADIAENGAALPFMGALSRDPKAIIFKQHHSHWSQTMKAMFTIFCSELPHPDYPPITEVNPAIPCVSLTEAASQAGYTTAFLTSADFAFDRKLRFYRHRKIDFMADRNMIAKPSSTWENSWGMDERVVVDAAANWIADHRQRAPAKPFFLLYQMVTGHHPPSFPGYQLAAGATADQEKEGRRKVLTFIDNSIERLWRHLERQGILDDTLFVVLSDHGPGSGRPGMGEARDASVYQRSIHVPFIMRGPQFADGPRSVDAATSHIDVAPTVLALLGKAPAPTMKGRDLLHTGEERAIVMSTRPPLSQIGVRAGPWKMVLWQETGAVELFAIEADPTESRDVATENPQVVGRLLQIAYGWRDHAENLIENYAEILSEDRTPCGPTRRKRHHQ